MHEPTQLEHLHATTGLCVKPKLGKAQIPGLYCLPTKKGILEFLRKCILQHVSKFVHDFKVNPTYQMMMIIIIIIIIIAIIIIMELAVVLTFFLLLPLPPPSPPLDDDDGGGGGCERN